MDVVWKTCTNAALHKLLCSNCTELQYSLKGVNKDLAEDGISCLGLTAQKLVGELVYYWRDKDESERILTFIRLLIDAAEPRKPRFQAFVMNPNDLSTTIAVRAI